jgi:lipoyl(octanoyl) transferase
VSAHTIPSAGGDAGHTVVWTDLGRMAYGEAWALQRDLVALRKAGEGVDRLLLVEHDPVLTLGRRGVDAHIRADRADLAARGIPVFAVERGGDVTFHGPGQLVAYPILDLHGFRRDVRWYSLSLLETIIRMLGGWGVRALAREGLETGVWVDLPDGTPAKIAALGVRIEHWIAYHGVAVNVDPDLGYFDLIVPCGLPGVRTVSLASLLGRPVTVRDVVPGFVDAFAGVFGARLVERPRAEVVALVEQGG